MQLPGRVTFAGQISGLRLYVQAIRPAPHLPVMCHRSVSRSDAQRFAYLIPKDLEILRQQFHIRHKVSWYIRPIVAFKFVQVEILCQLHSLLFCDEYSYDRPGTYRPG